MALTDDGNLGATMLVGPTGGMGYPYPVFSGGNGGNNGGFGGQDGWWIVLLIILLAAGNGFGNNGGNGGFGGTPYVINNDGGSVQRGFDQAAVMSGITGVQSGIQNLSTQLCSCCGDMRDTVSNGFYSAEIAASNRQMADMNQTFALQTAMLQGFNGVQSQFAECCCENRLANCQTQNIIQNEGNMTRFADANNTRDIIDNQSRNSQLILDKLCQLELDQYKRENDSLRSQLTDARFAASQVAQTAQIREGQIESVSALVNELRSCPIPAQPVYGSQPIFTCPNNNNSCGCGCGNNF